MGLPGGLPDRLAGRASRPTAAYSSARIKQDQRRARSSPSWTAATRIVIVTGFQGINKYGDITTLGRGGSDTSAVALAAALQADLCQIYTDVDGVYTADPRYVNGARKLEEITFDEMLELASLGAQVLHNRSVEMAKKYQRESGSAVQFREKAGHESQGGCKANGKDPDQRRGKRQERSPFGPGGPGGPRPVSPIKSSLCWAKQNINVDIILQSIGRDESQGHQLHRPPQRRGPGPGPAGGPQEQPGL